MSFNRNIVKFLSIIILVSIYSKAVASYESQIKQVDKLIQTNMDTIKSKEKLDIPEYKGDTLTFERLSKIRNIFNIDHLLPFEKRKPSKLIRQRPQKPQKLQPIKVPQELQEIMDKRETSLQHYPLSNFTFKGMVLQNNSKWGVIENSAEAKPIYIRKNQLIGQNYGKVENITKEGVFIKEWQKNKKERTWESSQVVIH